MSLELLDKLKKVQQRLLKDAQDLVIKQNDLKGEVAFYYPDFSRVDSFNMHEFSSDLGSFDDPGKTTTLVVDLQGVGSISFQGFEFLLLLQTSFKRRRGEIVLMDVEDDVKANLEKSGLGGSFRQIDSKKVNA